jgi:hypothetical protein
MYYSYAIYGSLWNKDFATIVIDTRDQTNTTYSRRFNMLETENGSTFVPLIIIQCNGRTSRDEGITLAEQICEGLNK